MAAFLQCGKGADPQAWEPGALVEAVRQDPAGTYAQAATEVLAAFAEPNVLVAMFTLPALGEGVSIPGSVAVGFHFLDYVVHAWDVARSVGASVDLPDDVLAAALPIAFAVPEGEYRTGANALFRPVIPMAESADDLDRILARLGRDPQWAAVA